jgi:hypothetical protein
VDLGRSLGLEQTGGPGEHCLALIGTFCVGLRREATRLRWPTRSLGPEHRVSSSKVCESALCLRSLDRTEMRPEERNHRLDLFEAIRPPLVKVSSATPIEVRIADSSERTYGTMKAS